jgi:hypothetical protein
MDNLKTTVSGGLVAVCQVVGMLVPGAHAICDPLSALAMALFAWFSKDK